MKSHVKLISAIMSVVLLLGSLPQVALAESKPFTTHTFPCEVLVTDFDIGEMGETYSGYKTANWEGKLNYRGDDVKMNMYDSDIGVVMGLNAGEWAIYTVNVPKSGDYTIIATYALASGEPVTKVSFDDNAVSVTSALEATGDWNTYEPMEIGSVYLSEGVHKMKLEMTSHGVNYRSITVESADQVKVDFSKQEGAYRNHKIPCVIQAEDFDLGADGAQSLDNKNDLRKYRKDAALDIGEIIKNETYFLRLAAGEAATYTFTNEVANYYTLSMASASASAAKIFIDDKPYPIKATISGTPDYASQELASFWLPKGEHKMKIEAESQLDMDLMKLTVANDGIDLALLNDGIWPPDAKDEEEEADEEKINPVWRELYVSSAGSESGDGSEQSPYPTIAKALETVGQIRSGMEGDIIINIAPGIYKQDETLIINEESAGANGFNVVLRGDAENLPTISGGTKISGWEKVDDKLWSAPADIEDTRTFYINDRPGVRARSKYIYKALGDYQNPQSQYSYDGMRISTVNFPTAIAHPDELEIVWDSQWTMHRLAVAGIEFGKDEAVILMDQPYWNNLKTKKYYPNDPGADKSFYMENAREFLDEMGEFYFDKREKRIYYYPFSGEDMTTAECYVGTTEQLMKVGGANIDSWLDGISFENLQFKHGAWNDVSKTGIVVNQADSLFDIVEATAAEPKMHGQIDIEYAKNVSFKNCRFVALGSTAILMDNAVTDSRIVGNVFNHISGSAISIGSQEHFDNLMPYMARCENISIKNNVIRRAGEEFRGSPAVIMYYVNSINVSHNDIANLPYTGISLGWGWGRVVEGCANNTIAYNRVEDVTSPTHDGAHIYTLGPMRNTTIHDNWCKVSGDFRGGIYADEGSRYLKIYNNVVQESENWLFARPNARLKDITVYDNFSDTEKMSQDTANVSVVNTTVVTDGNWPDEAKEIMNKSGVEAEYAYLLENIDIPEWRKDYAKEIPNDYYKIKTNAWIEAEDFDEGGEGIGYHKLELGLNTTDNWLHYRPEAIDVWLAPNGEGWAVGDTKPGEWLAYTVDVPATQVYDLIIYYSNAFPATDPDSKVSVYIDGEKVIDSFLMEKTPTWNDEREIDCGDISISEGEHTIRIEFVGNGFSFNRWRLKCGEDHTVGNEAWYDEGVYEDYVYALPEQKPTGFVDVENHWAKAFINRMRSSNLVAGVSETEFAPDRSISLYETVWLTLRVLGIEYTDNSWQQIAYENGFLTSAGEANSQITRERFAANMLSAYMLKKGSYLTLVGLAPYTDMAEVSPEYDNAVRAAKVQGLMRGDDTGCFRPKAALTRAEATVVFCTLMDSIG